MEVHAPWITCRMGKKLYLLAKDEKAFYLIEVGKNLDYATEEWLEQQGVSEALLKELKLPFTYIPKSSLRGVAITGNEAGEYVYLYLRSEKKKLVLELDYAPEWMDKFFFGFPRFTPPADRAAKKEKAALWRREKRDPELYDRLAWVAFAVGALGLGVNIGFLLFRNIWWCALWVIMLVVPVALVILMPGYFTLIPVDKGKKADAWELDLSVFPHILGLMVMMRNNWLDDSVFWKVAGICAVVCLVLLLLAEEFRRESPIWLILFSVMGSFFCVGAVSEANELLPHEPPQSYILEADDTYRHNGKGQDSYYCTVTLPDGREERLEISRKLYDTLEEGDLVRVEVGEGFFGIEYADVYPID